MEFIQVQSQAKIQIQSYNDHRLTINGEAHEKSLIALPDRLLENWPVTDILQLTASKSAELLNLNVKILLIGTGEKLVFPTTEMLAWFRQKHFGVEFMDTAAACRTFQILTSENRSVAAALIV
ncbi:MAG: hypothetical protein K0S08_1511 [Gammaproteobacteria bacterium]|jgi:uncharacterized protein|nr:hypothetical protein [Gammaproteobacteria bacterium]